MTTQRDGIEGQTEGWQMVARVRFVAGVRRTDGTALLCAAVAAFAASPLCLFPFAFAASGMDKLIHDQGRVTISNDGATIIKLLDIVHPAAKTLCDIAKSQDDEVRQRPRSRWPALHHPPIRPLAAPPTPSAADGCFRIAAGCGCIVDAC